MLCFCCPTIDGGGGGGGGGGTWHAMDERAKTTGWEGRGQAGQGRAGPGRGEGPTVGSGIMHEY